MPSFYENLDLGFTLNYVQSDATALKVKNNGISLIDVVSGSGVNLGDELCIESECFYTISSNDDSITMLSKYNLLVGYVYDGIAEKLVENPTGIQNENAKAWFSNYSANNPFIGGVRFSEINYWSDTVSKYPTYVYNDNSYLYEHVENYRSYLEILGITIQEARLISYEELINLGCLEDSNHCSKAPEWVCITSFLSGSGYNKWDLWRVNSNSSFDSGHYTDFYHDGVRPVIVISKSLF